MSSAYVQRVNVATADVPTVRRRWNLVCGMLPTASGVSVKEGEICGLHAEWLTPKDCLQQKLLLYLHGGGYVAGSCAMHRQMVSYIARAGRIQALLPEYRLAPEHKYPAAIDDAVAVYKAVLASGTRAGDIVLCGDSAGGGLCMALLLALREQGAALPAAAVLMSPFLDATASGESMHTRRDRDPWFHPQDVAVIADYYCEPQQRRDPLVSPVFADVSRLPPLYIQVGDDEILLSDSQRIAANIAAAGGEVDLDVWPEMWHVFQMFVGEMPEAKSAVAKIGDYVQARLS